MVERRVTFDVKVDVQEGEAGENVARAALILMARSLIKADEDLEAAAEADGWKFTVNSTRTTYTANPSWAEPGLPMGDVYCPYPGKPMPIIEPNNGKLGTSGWPKWPPVGTVVWARQGATNEGELFAYDGQGWRGISPAQYVEQRTALEVQEQASRINLQQQNHRAAERSRVTVGVVLDSWAQRLGKDPSDWDAIPPTTT